MKQYHDLLIDIMGSGRWSGNRTGIDTKKINCATMKFDLRQSFPIVTLKKIPFKTVVNEMLCFLRGYDNAKQFRDMGVRVWDQNANENEQWLANPNRLGEDDLGRIYGVQARNWDGGVELIDNGRIGMSPFKVHIDQLRKVYDDLRAGKDDRREIVTHWNPGELKKMALPPCHLLYQFGLMPLTTEERFLLFDKLDTNAPEEVPVNYLSLTMYQRSADMPLGVPFNITGYAWLLSVMAHITNTIPYQFLHVMHDAHIYANQIGAVEEMIGRLPKEKRVELVINPEIESLEHLETWVTADDFELRGYDPHPPIKIDMAV